MTERRSTGGFGLPLFILAAVLPSTAARGQSPVRPPLPAPTAAPPAVSSPTLFQQAQVPQQQSLQQLLQSVVAEALPNSYTDDRHWGRDSERFDGFRLQPGAIVPRTKRVNHGLWQRYTATLLDPEQSLRLIVHPLEESIDGKAAFDATLMLRARIEADYAQWTYGVKGLNGSVISDANIHARFRLLAAPQVEIDWERLTPRLGLEVKVHEVDFRLRDLNVHRIGVIDGWLARQIGDGSRKAVEVLVRRQSKAIASKLQERLDKLQVAAQP